MIGSLKDNVRCYSSEKRRGRVGLGGYDWLFISVLVVDDDSRAERWTRRAKTSSLRSVTNYYILLPYFTAPTYHVPGLRRRSCR